MINETLSRLIGEAYAAAQPVPRLQIVGGPEWIDNDRFDTEGVSQRPVTREQARLMLRGLLADRFKLVVHTETRPLPVFELVLARSEGKLGSELRRSDVDCVTRRTADSPQDPRVDARQSAAESTGHSPGLKARFEADLRRQT
jgi:uncharacterized protein (TIGR03435 family)